MKMRRYKFTIEKNGLRDYDIENVKYVLGSSSPKDAIRRVDKVLKDAKFTGKRLTYYAKQFLEAVAISAQTDIYEEEEC
jgi:hypothetical protein